MDKAGRNDPCPCGSGKKMKKCCGVAKTKKFEASIMPTGSSKMASLFNKQVIHTAEKTTTKESLARKVDPLKN